MDELVIEKGKAQCINCKGEFKDGSQIASAIYKQEGKFTRSDFCLSCWDAIDKNSVFSYWKRILIKEPSKRENIDAILAFFKELIKKDTGDPKEEKLKYILCLILMRRKQLKLIGTHKTDRGTIMRLEKRWDSETVDILDTHISEDEFDSLKGELDKLLNPTNCEPR